MIHNSVVSTLEDAMMKKDVKEDFENFKDMLNLHKTLCDFLGKKGKYKVLIEHCNEIIDRLPDYDYEDFK
jgi:hypothetical protein